MFQGISKSGLMTFGTAYILMLFFKPEICFIMIEVTQAFCHGIE